MTVEYLDRASHRRSVTGDLDYETKSCLVMRPTGARFTVTISRNRIISEVRG